MKRIYLIIVFLQVICTSIMAQKFSDSLYVHLYNYQIITGELNASEIEKHVFVESFNIEELVDSTNTKAFGIYVFYNLVYEESITSFLVIEDENVEIYDILSFSALVEKILDSNICNEKKKIVWIKKILKTLRLFCEDADMGSLVMQKDYGKYHYFIPLKNIKNRNGIFK